MIIAKKYPLKVRIGRDYKQKFTVIDKTTGLGADLTGWSIKAQIRASSDKDSSLIADFAIDATGLPQGYFYLSLTDAVTNGITADYGHYDVMFTDPSSFDETYFYGPITFIPSPTLKV